MGMLANLVSDSIWTIHQPDAHHHAEENEIWLSADRPGAGTGSEVLKKGFIQWERCLSPVRWICSLRMK